MSKARHIDLPDVRLPDATPYECGKTCVRCVLEYYGKPQNYADRLEPTASGGNTPDELLTVLRLAELPCIEGNWTEQMLRDIKTPVICYINTNGIDHYIVVYVVFRNRVYFFCPVDGKTSMEISDFINCWHSVDKHGNLIIRGGIAIGEQ